jgi:hypothetical protein
MDDELSYIDTDVEVLRCECDTNRSSSSIGVGVLLFSALIVVSVVYFSCRMVWG